MCCLRDANVNTNERKRHVQNRKLARSVRKPKANRLGTTGKQRPVKNRKLARGAVNSKVNWQIINGKKQPAKSRKPVQYAEKHRVLQRDILGKLQPAQFRKPARCAERQRAKHWDIRRVKLKWESRIMFLPQFGLTQSVQCAVKLKIESLKDSNIFMKMENLFLR